MQRTVKDWKNVIQIFRYLKEAKYYGILFNGEKCLKIYVDSDYANDKETRRSTTGFIYFVGSGPTSWYLKLQKCVATSIAEAKYYGLCEYAKQALWYRNILGEIKDQRECIKIYIDNQAAIYNAENNTINSISKHIDIKYHKIRELIRERKVELEYIESKNNKTDGLTKFLNKYKMQNFRNSLLYKNK